MTIPPPDPDQTQLDPLDSLAEEYVRRIRQGEEPAIEEFETRYPQQSGEIRRLLQTVEFLERGKRTMTRLGSNSGSGETEAAADPPQERLGENRVVRELGRGGMGIVYEAVQEPLGRRVAVKVLPRHALSNASNRKRFFREAQVIARLQHPHIVPIHSIGEQDGLPYFVMRLIDGSGLDRLPAVPAEAPADHARWVAGLGRQAASALAYAHEHGILHRDIKPANLLLDSTGTLWLADFGLAKLSDDLSLTSTGELPGTLRYVAPECLNSAADARSDIYSLGLTLYELLVGRPAFPDTDRIRLLIQIESHHVPAPRLLVPELPRDIETIVLKAMARDPSARYASASELEEDLECFLEGRPIKARRASRAERLIRWTRRNPLVAALTGTSVIFAIVAFIFIVFFVIAPPPYPPPGGPPDGPDFSPPPPRRGPPPRRR